MPLSMESIFAMSVLACASGLGRGVSPDPDMSKKWWWLRQLLFGKLAKAVVKKVRGERTGDR